MVMEAPPSPQSVGREFVRQYYTLLNKAPTHLHRFYNNQSSFVHGGLDPPNRNTSPVIGQKQIHQKIQQLNFRDCHAKITQVDSQATLGSGVVVQVTGELSNAGQPMRRFTQTFVLAAQSPKKYYVHNDIFRYQDIISDEECDADPRSDPEDEITPENQILDQQINQPAIPPYYPNAAPLQSNIPQVPPHHHAHPPPHVINPNVPTVNGAVHPEEMNVIPAAVQGHVPAAPAAIPPSQNLPPMQPPNPAEDAREERVEERIEPGYAEPEPEPEQELVAEPASNEPKTYANLLKSGSNLPYQQCAPQAQPLRNASPPSQGGQRVSAGGRPQTRPAQPQQQQARLPRQDAGGRMPGRNSINEEDRRRPQGMGFGGEVNQLFLGTLPHNATEEELRDIFGEFGTIVDLRVLTKAGSKGGLPGPRGPPNYGFITYESQQSVQACLNAKPIYYPKGDKNGTMLNVEERKNKERPAYGGGRPSSDNRGRGDNGARRGMGGPGGPNRNSSGGAPGPNRNNYNRGGGGPPNRGQNNYNRR